MPPLQVQGGVGVGHHLGYREHAMTGPWPFPQPTRQENREMTQTGGLAILIAWAIFAGLFTVLAYLLLRHEQDPLSDLTRPGPDDDVPAGAKPAQGRREDTLGSDQANLPGARSLPGL
jgi:hypothetical protein